MIVDLVLALFSKFRQISSAQYSSRVVYSLWLNCCRWRTTKLSHSGCPPFTLSIDSPHMGEISSSHSTATGLSCHLRPTFGVTIGNKTLIALLLAPQRISHNYLFWTTLSDINTSTDCTGKATGSSVTTASIFSHKIFRESLASRSYFKQKCAFFQLQL